MSIPGDRFDAADIVQQKEQYYLDIRCKSNNLTVTVIVGEEHKQHICDLRDAWIKYNESWFRCFTSPILHSKNINLKNSVILDMREIVWMVIR